MHFLRVSLVFASAFVLGGCGDIVSAKLCTDTSATGESCEAGTADAGSDTVSIDAAAGEAPDAGNGCVQPPTSNLLIPISCETSAPSQVRNCERLYDGQESTSPPAARGLTGTQCDPAGTSELCTYGSECPEGCIEDLWIRFDFGRSVQANHFRFLADWWNKRPDNWELWVSDDPALQPNAGATPVTAGVGARNPWQCVSGEACTDEVPDVCCPDGRDRPQDTRDVGDNWPKLDQQELSWQSGRYWYFLIKNTRDRSYLHLFEAQLFGGTCSS